MDIARGDLVTVKGSADLWEVVSAGPTTVRVRPANISKIRTAAAVPAASITAVVNPAAR
jgi:hypothetical protein